MARFEVTGDIDRLATDVKGLGDVTKNEYWALLEPGANVLVRKFREKLQKLFKQRTGKLAASIAGFKKSSFGQPYMLVYPYGDHHKYRGRSKTRKYKRSKSGRTYTYGGGNKVATANDVAFVLEYGSPARGINPHHWMEETMEESMDEVVDAMQEGFNELCERRGL